MKNNRNFQNMEIGRSLWTFTKKIPLVMKLFIFYLFCSISMLQAAESYAQNARLSLNVEEETVANILQQIENASDFDFFYNNSHVDLDRRVSVSAHNSDIFTILNEVFEGTGVHYTVLDKKIILSTELEASVQDIKQQGNIIKGKVVDMKGEPVIGATVKEIGTNNGAITDINGNFLITVQPNASLEVSFIGYKTEIQKAITGKTLAITLKENNEILDEVVIVGYGVQKKANLTGSVDNIDGQIFKNRPASNITTLMQGAVPNLNINFTSGRPNSSPAWNVRGLTSIGAGGEALILIDGVPGDPRYINSNDIANITVLKDAASASIYGSRGAFGVILITTKNPEKNRKPQITISSSYSFNRPNNKPNVVSDGYTWAKMFKESYSSWYDYSQTPSSIGSSGLPFSDSYLEELKYRSEHPGEKPDIDIDPVTGNYVYYGNTNWYDELYKKNIPSLENSIFVSGGSEKVDYQISGKIYKQEGIFKIRDDSYNKYDFKFKGNIYVNDWLKISAGTTFSNNKYTDPFRFNIWQVLNIYGNGTPLAMKYNPDGTMTQTYANSAGALASENKVETKQTFQQNNAGFETSFFKKALSIKGDFSYWITNSSTEDKIATLSYSVKPGIIVTTPTSSLAITDGKTTYLSYNLYADYTRTIGKHYFKILIGNNYETTRYEQKKVSRDGLLLPDLDDLNLAVGENKEISGGGYEWANNGVFARLNYSFNDRYLLELNGRYDGSSKFPKSKKFGFFPSVSVGWRISEEPFLKGKFSWLDNLKIRGSYGSLGNSQISPYLYMEQLKAATSPVIIDGSKPSYIKNPSALADNFTWETASTLNGGIDFTLFKRLTGSLDLYERRTYDMISPGPSLPAVFGATVPRGNYADLKTKGFELSISWQDIIKFKKPLSYSLRFTLADNVSHITKYYNPGNLIIQDPYTFTTNYYTGQCVGDIWGYTTEGIFTSEEDIKNHADQSAVQVSSGNKPMPGDIKFKDLNGDGYINKGDKTLENHGDWSVIGNNRPRFMYSFTINLDWNNFTLDAFFQGIGKRDWYFNNTEFWGQYNTWYAIIPEHTLKNNWSTNGNRSDSYWPRYRGPMVYGDRELQPQTKYLQNVSYLRLKNLSLAYSIPKNIISKIGISNLQFYIAGENLWTFTPLNKIAKGIDVECLDFESGARYNSNNYPILKTVTLGVNLSF